MHTTMYRAGIVIDPPEVVLVGSKGCGKTNVLEAMLGHPILSSPDVPCAWVVLLLPFSLLSRKSTTHTQKKEEEDTRLN